jgi:hypothetical protein
MNSLSQVSEAQASAICIMILINHGKIFIGAAFVEDSCSDGEEIANIHMTETFLWPG